MDLELAETFSSSDYQLKYSILDSFGAVENGNISFDELKGYTNKSDLSITVKVVLVQYKKDGRSASKVPFRLTSNLPIQGQETRSNQLIGHSTLQGMLTVGAVDHINPVDFFIHLPAVYTSTGPSLLVDPESEEVLFTRNTVDVMGLSNVSVSGAGGFQTPFPGTSAAAPHVAAIAALLKQIHPTAKPSQIHKALTTSAADMESFYYAVNDAVLMNADEEFIPIDVLGNDFDLSRMTDLEPTALIEVEIDMSQLKGDLVNTEFGVYQYIPPDGLAFGEDRFEYRTRTENGLFNVASVIIHDGISGAAAPILNDDLYFVFEGDEVEIYLTSNDFFLPAGDDYQYADSEQADRILFSGRFTYQAPLGTASSSKP